MLTRGSFQSYDEDRMVVIFSMRADGGDVSCAISTIAMDDMERSDNAARPVRIAPAQRKEQFERLRDRIEERAAEKYLAVELEGTPRGIILRSVDFR